MRSTLLFSSLSMLLATSAASAQVVGQNTQPGSDAAATSTISVSSQPRHRNRHRQGQEGQAHRRPHRQRLHHHRRRRAADHQLLRITRPCPTAPVTPPANPTRRENITDLQPPQPHPDRRRVPRHVRYKDRRLIAIYFDMTAMPPDDQLRALDAAQKFIRTQMTSADLVSIMRYGGGSVDVLQDFTDDRDRLLSILETLIVGEGQGVPRLADDASTADTGAAFGQDDSEFNIFNTDRQLSALQTAAKMLGQLNEKKSSSTSPAASA